MDPWAHRRGEPRVFAVLWVMYVMVAMAGSVHWVHGVTTVTPDSYSPAARIMLIVIAVGACVLWPMVRLSQLRPEGSVLRALALDSWVIAVPTLMVIWPMVYMAGWPIEIVLAMSALMTAWIALVSGMLAFALQGVSGSTAGGHRSPGLVVRSLWMLVVIAGVLGAPAAGLVWRAVSGRAAPTQMIDTPEWLDMLSPLTGVLAISGRGFAGPQHLISRSQWLIMMAVACCGAVAWLAAWRRAVRAGFDRRGVSGRTDPDEPWPIPAPAD